MFGALEELETKKGIMEFDRYTAKAQEAGHGLEAIAREYSNQEIQPVHLLWNLLNQDEGVAPALWGKL